MHYSMYVQIVGYICLISCYQCQLYYRKDDQMKIKKANNELPNLRHIIYSIVLIIEKLDESLLIDRIYVERFQMIYEIWLLIDNEINSRPNSHITMTKKKINQNQTQKISWNFIGECQKYEQIFGTFTNNVN